MSETGLLDLSPDLPKIRPVKLTEDLVQQTAECWRSCSCCHELLGQQAVQMCCCDVLFHVHCLRGFAKLKALRSSNGTIQGAIDFFCPRCNVTLLCRSRDVWTFLEESKVCTVLEMGEYLDKWLACLSKLNNRARVEFIWLAEGYENIRGNPSGAMQLPLKISAIRKLCNGQPAALEAFEMLYKERDSSFEAVLDWDASLTREEDLEDLENLENLIDAKTMYGCGPRRFVPRIVERLRRG